MKLKPFLIGGGIIVTLLLILVAAPFLIPATQYRSALEKSATESMGRDVKINGTLRFAFFPTLGLTAQQVTVANLPGGASKLFANVDELNVGVAAMPLLHGAVEVRKLVLKKPTISLEADVGGKPNWVFEPKKKDDKKGADEIDLDKLGLGDVRIEEGELTYRDKFGKVQTVSKLNATVQMKSISQPFALKSDFIYSADPVKLTLDVPTPRAFVDKKPTLLTVLIESEKLTAKVNGSLDPTNFALSGKVDAKGPSLRKLSAWIGSPIGDGGGMQNFAVIGDFAALGPTTTLTNAKIALDAATGIGNVTFTTADGMPPYVKGALALSELDVNPYLAAPQTPGAADTAKGVNVQQGWGKDKIDLTGLKAVNADLAITTGTLTFQKMKIDKSDMVLNLKDGVMRTTMRRLDLYGGVGAGLLVLDARGPVLKLQNSLNVTGLAAKPFLMDAVGFDKIEGTAKLNMAIGAAGDNQQALMESVVGKMAFASDNGALIGIDLAQISKQIQSALTGAAVGPAAKTAFSEMAADFVVTKGVAHTDNLRMLNPSIVINGAGDINLGPQTMDMKIVPKTVKTVGTTQVDGTSVPFRVKGPWAKLKFEADLVGLVQSQIDKALKDTKLPDLSKLPDIGSFFGQKPKPAPAPAP